MHDKFDFSDLPANLQELNARRPREIVTTLAPIELPSIDLAMITGLRRIQAVTTHTLLAFWAKQGMLFHDRRSGLQHILTVEQIRMALFKEED